MLGVKIQEPAFWEYISEQIGQPLVARFFVLTRGDWMRKIGMAIAFIMICVGVGVMLLPILTKKGNEQVQTELMTEYTKIVQEHEKSTKFPTAAPQTEEMDYSLADFIEKNTNDETRKIVDRQQIMGVIRCKKLAMEYIVVEGASRDNLRATIGHITGTAGFGGDGNCVLAGHRGGYYGTFFKNIDQLKNGDEVVLSDLYKRQFTYVVYDQQVVGPDALWICDRIPGENTLTLLSCEDNGTRRRIVRCRLGE